MVGVHPRSFVSRLVLALAIAVMPSVAGAVATNLTLTTPAGPAVREQVIVLDAATDKEVERKESDDRGAVYFELPEGRYRVKTRSGGVSETFRVAGPGPVTLSLELGGAAAGAASAAGKGFELDLEVGYRHIGGDIDTTAHIDLPGWSLARQSVGIDTDGAVLTGRLHFPCEFANARPFFEVGGDLYPSADGSGAMFGTRGRTGLNTAEVELEGSLGFGGGLRWGFPVGHSEIGVSPTIGFNFDVGRLSAVYDETAFGFPLVRENKSFTTASAVFGGNVEFRPCRDGCGFYVFAGGNYRVPFWQDHIRLEGQTPGGFDGPVEAEVEGRWQAQVGVGYRFNLGTLGF